MKFTAIVSIKVLFNIILVTLFLTSCIGSGKEINAQSSTKPPQMDIQAAVISGNLEVVKQHIKAGTNLNAKDPFSQSTPLITAATFGKKDIAKALIDGGADLTVKNGDGSTALHSAAFFCEVEIVQMLLDAKADKTVRNNYGATPRETVMGPFSQIKPVYEMMAQQLSPMGLQLDLNDLEKTRPVIAKMLQ